MSSNLTYVSISMENVSPDSSTVTVAFIQLAYGIPSFFIMIAFLFFLGCKKAYNPSFYRLVQLDLFTNIILYTNTWIAIRIAKQVPGVVFLKGLETALPGLQTWTVYFTGWFMHMQFMSAVALSLHRITSVVWHSRYEALWSRYYPLFGLLCCLYSTLAESILPGKTITISILNNTLTQSVDRIRGSKNSTLIAVYSVVYFVLLAGINTCTAYLVTAKFKAANISDRGVGKKLTKIALTYSIIYLGILFWSVTSALNQKFQIFTFLFGINSMLLTFASDMMTLALPYILLVYDTNVRNDVCWKKKSKTTPVLVSIGPQTRSMT